MTAKPKLRETAHNVRLKLECQCGTEQTLWVHPDASSKSVAKAHGWAVSYLSGWVCPNCREGCR